MSSWQRLVDRAKTTLEEARLLLEAGHPVGAADRSYYAMFYAASALLAAEGIDVASHRALLAAFGKDMVKTGRVDAQYHRMLLDAFDLRQTADYDVQADVDLATAREAFCAARDFIGMAEAILKKD